MKGNFHARFWIGGEESDLLADHTRSTQAIVIVACLSWLQEHEPTLAEPTDFPPPQEIALSQASQPEGSIASDVEDAKAQEVTTVFPAIPEHGANGKL